jgi:tRNA-specific 2-thiouridylase
MSEKEYNKTVVAAMSGGVDSSVAAVLLKQDGYEVIGITIKTWGYDDFPLKDSGCCSLEAIYNAKNVCQQIGIPHYTMDFTKEFNETVIENFISEYMHGFTPNPCVLCNKLIKWGLLLEKAKSLGADRIATGHYANVNYNDKEKRYYIQKSKDETKDQTYALWQLSQDSLSRTLFPLGNYTKKEIRIIAGKMGLKTAATPDSQEICFVPDNDYRELLQIRIPGIEEKIGDGDIIYKGKKIGRHKGFYNYTIGQRRGLKVALGNPVYVSKIDSENNLIFLDDEEGLYNEGLIANNINLMMCERIEKTIKAKVKVRYKDGGSDATLEQIDDNNIKVIFESPKKSITPGQSAVFYIGDDVFGGGIITKAI